jgi:hypothetical protein
LTDTNSVSDQTAFLLKRRTFFMDLSIESRSMIIGLALNVMCSVAYAGAGAVKDPAGVAPDRYVYYPGTEALAEDEIRVIACGTGMPAARRGEAATCFLAELGIGE